MLTSVERLVDIDISELHNIEHLEQMPCREGLIALGEKMLNRAIQPDVMSFYRMGVPEVMHFQELSERMETTEPKYIQDAIAGYLCRHVKLPAQDFSRAAALFLEMLFAEPRNKALFGYLEVDWDAKASVAFVVQVFLYGYGIAEQGAP